MKIMRKHLKIDREYLEREYVGNRRSAFDIANEHGLRAKFIIERLKRVGISPRDIKTANSSAGSLEKRKRTCTEKYGCDNVSKSKSVINKIKRNTDYEELGRKVSIGLKKRTKEEWIESYRKRAITFLQKYGVENVSQLPETRRKIRLSLINRIQNQLIDGGQVYPAYNPTACKLIDKYGKKHGYHFQHALNGGEYFISHLGYWVDGYDKRKNVVLEVDEPHHFDQDGSLRERDIRRQKEIELHLKCKFIRIKNII
jgi:hypothetical protein